MYKIGDRVLLRADRGPGWESYGAMDKYCNQIVTISNITREHVFFEEGAGWTFWQHDIVCLEDFPGMEERKKEIEEEKIRKALELEELKKTSIFTEEQIKELIEENFGDSGYTEKSGNRIFIYLKFPEIEITNSREDKNKIKDLYIRICISSIDIENMYKFDLEFQGRRTTFSLAEYKSNYIHSHLPSGGFYNWNNFCLGSSDFSLIIESLKLSPTKENWELFLLSIPNYLSWESIEGGPHISMRSITLSGQISKYTISEELKRICGELPLDIFEWIDTLSIRETPYLYDFFNRKSKLRTLTAESIDLTEEAKSSREYFNKQNKLKWKEDVIDYIVYYEAPVEGNIEKGLVDKYIELLKKETKKFTKKINYARNKKELGEVGIV